VEGDVSREGDGAMGEVDGSNDGELENERRGTPEGRKDLKVDSESIASLSAKILNVNLKRMEPHSAEISEEEPEEEIPVLVHHDLPNLVSVLEMADVVLQVLDARDPLSFRIKHVEEFANDKGKKSLFVLNKIGGSLFSFVTFLAQSDFPVPGRQMSEGGCCCMDELFADRTTYLSFPVRFRFPFRRASTATFAASETGQGQGEIFRC
jgi:hypothetical protein